MQPIRRVVQRFKNWFNYWYRLWRHREAATVYSLFGALVVLFLSLFFPKIPLPIRLFVFAACAFATVFFALFLGNEIYLLRTRRYLLRGVRENQDSENLFFTEWVDFVRFPHDPESLHTAQQRMDTKGALRYHTQDTVFDKSLRFRVEKKDIVWDYDSDVFEAMIVDRYGGVGVWTKNRVWFKPRGLPEDKLVYVDRNPPVMRPAEAVAPGQDKIEQ